MKNRFLCCLLAVMMVLPVVAAMYPRKVMAEEFPAGVSKNYPDIAYDQNHNTYLTVYGKQVNGTGNISGQFVDAQGRSFGAEMLISAVDSSEVQPSVVNAVYNGVSAYLAVWLDDKIYGQFIDAGNGTFLGQQIQISDDDAIPRGGLSVAYDSVNQRSLVVWEDYRYPADDSEYRSRDIYGQLVSSNAALQGANFAICDNGAEGSQADQYDPAVAFDSQSQKYLVVWEDFRSFNTNDIYGQFISANGEIMGHNSKTNFVISDASGNQDQAVVTYDSVNQRFLVAFRDFRNGGSNTDIYGQIVSGESVMGDLLKSTSSENFVISSNGSHQYSPALSFNPTTQRYLVAWEDERNAPNSIDIYGQMVNADGNLYPVPSNSISNMTLLSRDGLGQTLSLALNSQEKSNLIVDSYSSGDGSNVIDYALVPAEVNFQAKVDYCVGAQPYGIVDGDFNHDGRTDLAVTNGNSNNYSILTSTTEGAFTVQTSAADLDKTYAPIWAATGDFNADNHQDLAMTTGNAKGLSILSGDGSGSFPMISGLLTGTSPNTVVTSDFDGDGDLDLAVSNGNSNNVSVYLNDNGNFGMDSNGDGINEPNQNYNVDSRPARMVATDLNQDSYPDLAVVCNSSENVHILLNEGAGTFNDGASFWCGDDPIGIVAADFNNNGTVDLAVANFDTMFDFAGNISIFQGSGDGDFNQTGNLTVNDGPVGIVAADFNSDGTSDLAVANRYRNNVSLLLGNGRGGFVRQDFAVGAAPVNLIADDLNGDGNPDLAVVNLDGDSVSLLLNAAMPDEEPADSQPPVWPAEATLTPSDITNNSLKLTWTMATDNIEVTGYKIYIDNNVIATVAGDVSTYDVTDLNPDTMYTFKIEARDAAGNWSTDGPGANANTLAETQVVASGMELLSISSTYVPGNGTSNHPSVSADGNYVAFSSTADNLAGYDNNQVTDIFVRNRLTGETECVSVSSGGTRGDGNSFFPSISGDGRYVVFESYGSGLVAGDSNNVCDIFLHDRQQDTTILVSKAFDGSWANNASYKPFISTDGRYIVFSSRASNLVEEDTNNNLIKIFLFNTQTQEISRISANSDGDCDYPMISADNRYIVYSSTATNLVSGDENGVEDVFCYDREKGLTTLVSVAYDGSQSKGASQNPSISANGRYIAFWSDATNIVNGDINNSSDVFVRDREAGTVTLVSVNSDGLQGNGYSFNSIISSDGRYVAFTSDADNLIDCDSNDVTDVFVHDIQSGQTICVSEEPEGAPGNGFSDEPCLSLDGSYITFSSGANNLVSQDVNELTDVFICKVDKNSFPGDEQSPSWTGGCRLDPSEITQTDLRLTWSAATDNVEVTGYRIYCNDSIIATVSGDVLAYVVTSLNRNTAYFFKVEAGDAAGNWSSDGPTTTAMTADEEIPTSHGGGGSYTSPSEAATIIGSILNGSMGNKAGEIAAAVTTDKNGRVSISMKGAQVVVLSQPDGTLTPLGDLANVEIASTTGTPVTVSADGTILVTNLDKGTDYNFNIMYDLGNGQKITFETMKIKIDDDGTITLSITLIDPYGNITDAATGNFLEGVQVSLYYAATDRNIAAGKTPDMVVPLPGIAGFNPNDNQNPQTSDTNGAYGFMVFPVTDYYIVASKEGYDRYISPTIAVEQEIVKWDFRMSPLTSGVTRLAGLTKIDTALAIAKGSYPGKITNVLLATADNYPDALAGSILAYKLNAPILLVGSSEADQEKVLNFMTTKLDPAGTVYILGGTAAVSSAMENKVKASGFQTVTRLSGESQYDTSAKIASQLKVKTGTPIVLVSGESYSDALSISSVAAQMQLPILLVQKDGVSDTVLQEIATIKPSKVYVIGGQGIISTVVEKQVVQNAGLAQTNITRIGGVDRYETSLAVAQFFFNMNGKVCIATGNDFSDALAGSAYAANHNATIILVDVKLSDKIMNYLQNGNLTGATIFGGEAVISKGIEQQLRELIGQ
ncbi:cell wall-binding protein [Desulfosporosinus orientis DSM 765]|uniref:Cell wall-binding protein n=1 Tax=Desulfosporosinus orientis (strain ATCC 19365 / DSM 765 / NCIMB 8382 / VKM B-1628 / Singapore I) TaxID=768706 RepID=G7W7R7_DESOD|nr:cell wall-binding repeat-containing protein [Desulfosporosinus orientis]AET66132.1 cell wall-binding protein [Desulfosporosinus orientis DSM 765]